MKGWEVPELIFWVIVALLVALIIFLFANQIIFGYLNVEFVVQP